MDWHAQGLVGAFDWRQDEARPAGAEDDRRDDHVQAVEAAGGEKARDGFGATFDQDAAQPALGQCGEDRGRRDMRAGIWQRQNFNSGRRRAAAVRSRR